MSDLAIRVENLGKQYRIGSLQSQQYQTLRDALASAFQRSHQRSLPGASGP